MPQPILKRAHSARPPAPSHPPLMSPQVHWPSSPALTRTFSAHSPAQYDRSPIQVTPNACELPARGCPGRTYYDGAPSQSGHSPKHLFSGKTLHPRAIAAYEAQFAQEEADDDDETELERTPTRTSPYIPLPVPPPIPASYHPNYPSYSVSPFPPPLVPDLSSSSDESDGFVSPPPETAAPYYGGASTKYPYFGYPNSPPYQPPPALYPSERKRRSRRPSPRRPIVQDGYEEEDLPGSFSHAGAFTARVASISPPRDRSKSSSAKEGRSRKEKCAVASLCRSLAGTGFGNDNEGCLGGF
ncbi:hypothetical protein C8F01DRAFT_1256067 [Mycena amicta]|nr:hypothetical protein C8F01DRAFT_1256067 [Mycena amicta]